MALISGNWERAVGFHVSRQSLSKAVYVGGSAGGLAGL